LRKQEDIIGEKLEDCWIGEAPDPRFESFVLEARDLGFEETRDAPVPPDQDWYVRNRSKPQVLASRVGRNSHGLRQAVHGVYRFFSVHTVMHLCEGNSSPEYREATRHGVREMADVQRMLMQACVWLGDDDIMSLTSLPVKHRFKDEWQKTIHGALAAACVARVLLNAGLKVRYPDPETDVHDGVDLFAPDFPEYGPLAIQVKSMRASKTMILPIRNPHRICDQLGLEEPTDKALIGLIHNTYRKVLRLNERLGTSYTPMLAVIGGLNTRRPSSEKVREIAGSLGSK